MNRLVSAVCASVFLLASCYAQQDTQSTNAAMSVREFRQVLLDLGSYIDSHKRTNLRQQFEALTDEQLGQVLPAVRDPHKLKGAIAKLKEYDAKKAAKMAISRSEQLLGGMAAATFPACTADTIIDNSPTAACAPAYPDPTNSAWQNMVNPPITFGAFSPSDYPDVAMQQCGLTVESNLVQVVSALNGTVTVAAIACGAIPLVPEPCFAAVAVVGVAGAVAQGILADCSEQDGNVNAAEIDAAFHNTVTIYDALNADNNQITGEFNSLSTQVTNLDTHLTNVDAHIAAEFAVLDAHLVTLFNQLTTQLTNATALNTAEMKQVMKLLITPDGLKVIDPPILTCTGANCPNVLNHCVGTGGICNWNDEGQLP